MRADRRPRQHGRCSSHWLIPVPASLSGRPCGAGDVRNSALRASGGCEDLQARPETLYVRGEKGILPHARPAPARRGDDSLGVRRCGTGRRGKPLRLWSVHGFPSEPSQRTVHARRPDVLRWRLHIPDPRPTGRAGQRCDPAEDSERRFDPVCLCSMRTFSKGPATASRRTS